MNASTGFAPRVLPRWVIGVVFLIAAALAARFIARDVFHYAIWTRLEYTDYYWPRRLGLALHVGGGALALTTGLVQLWLGISGRTRQLHRYLGRVYLGGVLAGAGAGCYMAATIPPPGGSYATGLIGLNSAWIVTTSIGYLAIRRRSLVRHREWMLRSYVVTFGFVVLRLIEPMLGAMGFDENSRFGAAAWGCWTVPLLVTEIFLRRKRAARLPEPV